MNTTLPINNNPVVTPLDALVAHFNASSKNVQKAFTKLILDRHVQEEQTKLDAKINKGMLDIKAGKGIYKEENESVEQFFDRLCIE